MKRFATLLSAGLFLTAIGCGGGKTDPRSQPGFVDTSDPNNVMKTMKAPPGKGADPTALFPNKGKQGP